MLIFQRTHLLSEMELRCKGIITVIRIHVSWGRKDKMRLKKGLVDIELVSAGGIVSGGGV